MDFALKNKTALITGASSGLGERFARVLSRYGVRVILAARREQKLEALSKELSNALPLKIDVTDKYSVKAAFKSLEESGEKIDICINSAGWAKLTPIFEEDLENNMENIMQLNVMGTWHVIKEVANHMKSRNTPGSIINIASVNGQNRLREGISGYCASKAAVIQMTKALVGELSKEKIRINCISPGLFHTPLTDYKLKTSAQKSEQAAIIPLGFVGDPEDLDTAVLYLSSNKASRYVTGSCLTVDGGVSWGGA